MPFQMSHDGKYLRHVLDHGNAVQAAIKAVETDDVPEYEAARTKANRAGQLAMAIFSEPVLPVLPPADELVVPTLFDELPEVSA